jgi:hypothetical protein
LRVESYLRETLEDLIIAAKDKARGERQGRAERQGGLLNKAGK